MTKPKVLITGASTGIGYSCAKIFIENGCRVFGSVRKEADAERVSRDLGHDFIPLIFDVSDHVAILREAEKVKEILGEHGLSCLINNAGIAVPGPLMHIPIDDLRKQFEVNVFGLFDVTKTFLPMLGAIKDYPLPPGKIINISSVAGQLSTPFMGPYTGSKHALEGMTNCLRRELLLYGVDVVTVAPGPIKTPIWKKALGSELSDEIMNSDYGTILKRILKNVDKKEKEAMEADDLAKRIYNIFKANNPKTYYIFRRKKFTQWTIPRYLLPARALDRIMKKMLKM
ncbi:MAG: SDR family oxidoreductase [Cyclobacteriaceae bacterium]